MPAQSRLAIGVCGALMPRHGGEEGSDKIIRRTAASSR
jgi:hypothetical protein